MYDPKTDKWSLIDTCFSTQHLYFAHDANNTLWASAGGPDSGVAGLVNTKMYDQTGDAAKSQGWTPLIIDTNGNGKRDEYVEANQPLDPKGQAHHGGILRRSAESGRRLDLGPIDGRWILAIFIQPGYVVRLVPGSIRRKRRSRSLPSARHWLRVARYRSRS